MRGLLFFHMEVSLPPDSGIKMTVLAPLYQVPLFHKSGAHV